MTTTTTDTTPRVWIGCLACYNAGRLIGEWFPAVDAGDVTTYDVHGAHSRADSHDELWVMDHEYLPITGECSPAEAAAWAELLDSVDEWQRDAFRAWVTAGDYSHDGDGLPSVSDFEDAYCGEWDTFQQYAEELAEDTGLLAGVPDEFVGYFDWQAWARDLAYDYNTADAPSHGVYVFRTF